MNYTELNIQAVTVEDVTVDLNATVIKPTLPEQKKENYLVVVKRAPNRTKGVLGVLGVFARRGIPENTQLAVFPGDVIRQTTFAPDENGTFRWAFFQLMPKSIEWKAYTIDAKRAEFNAYAAKYVKGTLDEKNANVRVVYNFTRLPTPALEYWTSRPIVEGEELFVSYQNPRYLVKFDTRARGGAPLVTSKPRPSSAEALVAALHKKSEELVRLLRKRRRESTPSNAAARGRRQPAAAANNNNNNNNNAGPSGSRSPRPATANRNARNTARPSGSRSPRSATANRVDTNRELAQALLHMAGAPARSRNATPSANRPPLSPASRNKLRMNILRELTAENIATHRPDLVPRLATTVHTIAPPAARVNGTRNARNATRNARNAPRNARNVTRNARNAPRNARNVTRNARNVTRNARNVTRNAAARNAAQATQNAWNRVEQRIRNGRMNYVSNPVSRTMGHFADILANTVASHAANHSRNVNSPTRARVYVKVVGDLKMIAVKRPPGYTPTDRETLAIVINKDRVVRMLVLQGRGMTLGFELVGPDVRVIFNPPPRRTDSDPNALKRDRDALIVAAILHVRRRLAQTTHGPILGAISIHHESWTRQLSIRGDSVTNVTAS
jgi:hypothetical protein